jgi:hypothetical protein
MSLINEALKKAQRERSNTPSGVINMEGAADQRNNRPVRTPSVMMLGAGAAVLVLFSIVLTVYFLTPAPTPITPAPVVAAAEPIVPINLEAPSPVVAVPVISVPAAPVVQAPVSTAPEPVVTVAPVEIPKITPVREPELQIQLFVDAIRVMGVRSSGGESKVLMNDRVYRVNDIVDRKLVLKLVKVEPELLTFTDPNGMVYTKSF